MVLLKLYFKLHFAAIAVDTNGNPGPSPSILMSVYDTRQQPSKIAFQ